MVDDDWGDKVEQVQEYPELGKLYVLMKVVGDAAELIKRGANRKYNPPEVRNKIRVEMATPIRRKRVFKRTSPGPSSVGSGGSGDMVSAPGQSHIDHSGGSEGWETAGRRGGRDAFNNSPIRHPIGSIGSKSTAGGAWGAGPPPGLGGGAGQVAMEAEHRKKALEEFKAEVQAGSDAKIKRNSR